MTRAARIRAWLSRCAPPVACACFAGVLASASPVHAQAISGELVNAYAWSRDKDEQRSLLETTLYVEKALGPQLAVFFSGYNDNESRSAAVGLARKAGALQFALGLGYTRMHGADHAMAAPWAYYQDDVYRALLYAEFYTNETDTPRWFKGYVLRRSGAVALGAYGDSSVGVGPRLDILIGEHLNPWIMVPAVLRPNAGAVKVMLGFGVEF